MKKKNTEKLLNWDAHYVGIKETRERQQNCITLDEVAYEAAVQLYRSVPFTIEGQIPVFTEWVANASSKNTESRKNSCWRKRKVLLSE
jgi:hypothetical protein